MAIAKLDSKKIILSEFLSVFVITIILLNVYIKKKKKKGSKQFNSC